MCACIFARNGKTTARVASNFQSVSFVLDFFAFAQGSRGNITSLEVSPAANPLPLRNSTLPGIATLKSYISCVLRCCIVGELTECMEMHKHFTLRLQSSLNLRNVSMGAPWVHWRLLGRQRGTVCIAQSSLSASPPVEIGHILDQPGPFCIIVKHQKLDVCKPLATGGVQKTLWTFDAFSGISEIQRDRWPRSDWWEHLCCVPEHLAMILPPQLCFLCVSVAC